MLTQANPNFTLVCESKTSLTFASIHRMIFSLKTSILIGPKIDSLHSTKNSKIHFFAIALWFVICQLNLYYSARFQFMKQKATQGRKEEWQVRRQPIKFPSHDIPNFYLQIFTKSQQLPTLTPQMIN